jgi:hypothetical protein
LSMATPCSLRSQRPSSTEKPHASDSSSTLEPASVPAQGRMEHMGAGTAAGRATALSRWIARKFYIRYMGTRPKVHVFAYTSVTSRTANSVW